MILEHDRDIDDLGTWSMGTCKVFYYVGHNEYPIRRLPEVKTDRAWKQETYDYDYDAEPSRHQLPDEYRPYVEDEDELEWATYVVVECWVVELARAFYDLSMQLDPDMDPVDYTPGGDDDTFDYWPSGMQLLHAMAVDLDTLTRGVPAGNPGVYNRSGTRYIDRYMEVLLHAHRREVPELEGSVPLADEL